MTAPARYFDLVREMKNAYNNRLRLVESAKQRGIKPTARLFATTVPTVRKWLRRYQQHGLSGLLEHPPAHPVIRRKYDVSWAFVRMPRSHIPITGILLGMPRSKANLSSEPRYQAL